MFTAHIDDSGTAPEHKVAVATALIVPVKKVFSFHSEWDKLKEKHAFVCFHMAEFAVRERKHSKNQFRDWDTQKASRVYARIRQIIKKYGVHALTVGVKKADYDEVFSEDIRKYTGRFHYSWAVFHLLDFLAHWRGKTNCQTPLEYVFSWMRPGDERRKEIEEILSRAQFAAEQVSHSGEFDNWSFRHALELPGLQCVDVLAWISYQFSLLIYSQKPMLKEAEIGWPDFYGPPGKPSGFLDAWVIRRSQLEKFVEHMRNTKHTEEWFAKWRRVRDEQQIAK